MFLAFQGLEGTPEYEDFMEDKTSEYLNKYAYDAPNNANTSPNCD